jgi:hypothetical protein
MGSTIAVALAAAPTANDDIIASLEGLTVELDFLHLNDVDADGDSLSITGTGSPSSGSLILIGANHYQYSPNAGFKGRDSFSYTISDGNGGTDTGTVTISVNASVDPEGTRDALLSNVTQLLDPTQPGNMTVWGPSAFSVSNYPGQNETSPMIAAGTLGAGKVIAMPDHQWLNMNNYGGDPSTGNFYKNGMTWLAGSSSLSLKIVTMNSDVSTWLIAEGYTNVVSTSTANLASDLQGAAVYVPAWLGSNPSQATIDITGDFVRAGGGLFLCDYSPGYSWWWGKDKWEIPGSRLLREAGIVFTGNGYSNGVQAINRADDEVTLEEIEAIFANPPAYSQNEKDLAVGVMQNLLDSLHVDDIAYARLQEAFGAIVSSITPSELAPVTDSFERQLLEIECSLLSKLDPVDMTPHRAALAVDGGAPRVSNASFGLDSPPSAHSTKTIYTPFYAPPGELITIDFPAALSSINLDVRVSHLRSGNGGSSFPVMPNQMINFEVTGTQVEVANPHGGLIQIIVPGNVSWTGSEQITVSGAVEVPYFKLGTTTDAAWIGGIRDRGTPFGILDSGEATLVIDADLWLRSLDDPEAVITEWDFFCGKVREFYAYDQGRQLPIHHDYYPAGGVSTYPQSYGRTSSLVDSLNLQSSAYALTLHEYGHICDSGNIIFYEFGETAPNMGGKWLQETLRKYSWKQELTVGRINNFLTLANDDLWNHYNHYRVDVKGTPFDLLGAEFGAQMIQDSVAAITAMPSGNFPDSQAKIDEWIRQTSNRTGYNMSSFFAAWEIPGSASVQSELSGLADWMPIERVEETLTVAQDTSVVFVDPSSNDFSYDGGLNLVSVGQPGNGTVTDQGDGTYTYTPVGGYLGSDSFVYTVSNSTGNQFSSTIPVNVVAGASDPKMVAFDGYAHGGGWITVNLEQSYNSMIVIGQPLVGDQSPPMVARIRNATGSSFEVKLDRLDGSASPLGYTGVRFLVVEEGVYDVATHGIKMEAVKFTSTTTDTAGNFTGTERAYAYTGYDHYFIPAVFGQVMTSNDANWSAFWFKAGANSIQLGKHVGEDPSTSRSNEDIGYVVVESGSYQVGNVQFQIGVAGVDGYSGFGNISDGGSSYAFDRFPAIHSALTSSDLSVPWGGSNPGEDGFVNMQKVIGGNGISAYLAEDTLGDSETATGDKSTSYLLAHYTGSNPLPVLDSVTALAGSESLIKVLENDINVQGVSLSITQPSNGQVVIHSDGSLIYSPDNGFAGSDSFTYSVDGGSGPVTAPVLIEVVSQAPVQTGLIADRFDGISGNSISDLTGSANYPDSPSSTSLWTSIDSGQNVGDSLGHHVYGVIVPPTTGDYTFWIASDDYSRLSLSSDHSQTNLVMIASVNGYTGYQSWDQSTSQKSAVLQLEAGKAYAIEILHKEGGGGDHVSVAWEGPGFTRTLLTAPGIFTGGDNAPFLQNSIANVVMDEGDPPQVIDLTGVFADNDPGDFVTLEVHENSNPGLIQTALDGVNLTLSQVVSAPGAATVTVRGTDRLNTLVTTSFTVTVNMVNAAPAFSSDPFSRANATEDVAYAESIAGSATDPDSDPLSYSKLSGPSWLSVASNGALSGTPSNSDVGTNQWSVQVSDGNGGLDSATLEITVDPVAAGPISYNASGESTSEGTASGGLAALINADNAYETLTEAVSGGNPSKRRSSLTHQWTFNVTSGIATTLRVEAHHTANSEGDDFIFSYSSDGSNFTDVLTVAKTSDDDIEQTASLPANLNGLVYIRVIDADNSQGNQSADSLYVDLLTIDVTPLTGPPAAAANPTPSNGATGVSLNPVLSWDAAGGADSYDVYFGTSAPGIFQGNQSGTSFTPGTLTASTLHYWRIDSVNGNGTTTGTAWSFTTGTGGGGTLFSDDFEDGNLNGWSLSGGVSVKSGAAYTGVFGAELKNTSNMTVTVDTSSAGSVSLDYDRTTSGLDGGESLTVEWSADGTNWFSVESTSATGWGTTSTSLPAGAAGQAALQIRFSLNANRNNEKAFVDNVIVSSP